jgi:hypothetical protein
MSNPIKNYYWLVRREDREQGDDVYEAMFLNSTDAGEYARRMSRGLPKGSRYTYDGCPMTMYFGEHTEVA